MLIEDVQSKDRRKLRCLYRLHEMPAGVLALLFIRLCRPSDAGLTYLRVYPGGKGFGAELWMYLDVDIILRAASLCWSQR